MEKFLNLPVEKHLMRVLQTYLIGLHIHLSLK